MIRTAMVAALVVAGFGLGGCTGGGGNAAANNAAAAASNVIANEVSGPETPAPPVANGTSPAANLAGGAPTGGTCGGVGGVQCASARDFCQHRTGQCNVPDGQGTCVTRPEICNDRHDPVCGCDGRTYDNACRAAAAGVSVQAQGACPGR